MEKILKKYTRIPENLYVNRSADLQLKRIIDDMQRPGYVLVARQMGKTNLLINAKRTLENDNRLFVYIDLSNLFDTERDCYRNIIDTIVESNELLFNSILDDIKEVKNGSLPAHNEYTRSLRLILKVFKGDLVIVLDEIDALKSVPYSDNIFAQIRSNYFSRTNFPEFERLTYVLSGVIEPTELIKDPNKSPFNIGDKIYLDDFSEGEHKNFIEKSRLKITEEVSDEIFNWAKGNPRLTFDICSELENYILIGKDISNELIEEVIRKKYLTTFDVAPIDHIRELVKSNKQIRKSVSLINKKQSEDISDEIKKKLYLFGIIDSKFDRETKIKNKIIEYSLSEEWIRSIEKLSTDNYNYGLEKIESGDYKEAILALLEFLSNSSPTKLQIEVCYYNIGYAYYQTKQYEEAIEYFSKTFTQSIYKSNSLAFLGNCKIVTGKVEEGIQILEEIIRSDTNNFAYRNAILNLANNLPETDNDRALFLYDLLYKSTFDPEDISPEADIRKHRVLSLFYQSHIYWSKSDIPAALNKINEALNYSDPSDSLLLVLNKYNLEATKDESLKHRLVSEIINNELKFDKQSSYSISFNEDALYLFLDFVFDEDNLELFNSLLNYSISNLIVDSDKYELIYKVANVSDNKGIKLLNYLTKFSNEIKDELIINIYWTLAYNQPKSRSKFFESFNEYLKYFKNSNRLQVGDIYLFATAIRFYFEQTNFIEAIKLGKIIEPKFSGIEDENLKPETSIIYYWLAVSYTSIKDKINFDKYSDIALKIIADSKKNSTSMVDEKGLSKISEQLLQIKYASNIKQPIVNTRKYGRNDRVKVRFLDGREEEKKYKQIEGDLLAERCIIVG